MSVNDWGAAMARAAEAAIREEAKGAGSIARFVAKHLAPEIGGAVQRGALAWRTDSDECMKQVNAFMREAMSCDSIKGLSKDAAVRVRNLQSFLARAIKLYRACGILAAQHGDGMDSEGRVPLAWFVPAGREMFIRKGAATHVSFTGKARISIALVPKEDSEESVEVYAFTVSESAVNALAFPKAKPDVPERDAPDVTTLGGAISQASAMLARAMTDSEGKPATLPVEPRDAFLAMVRQFMDASPANLALIAGMVDAARKNGAAESAAA